MPAVRADRSEGRLAVYDGQSHLGFVEKRAARFNAFDADGKRIGTFENRKDAIAEIARTHARSNAKSAADDCA
jgi:hypothetical protein